MVELFDPLEFRESREFFEGLVEVGGGWWWCTLGGAGEYFRAEGSRERWGDEVVDEFRVGLGLSSRR